MAEEIGTPIHVQNKSGFCALTDVEIFDRLKRGFYKCHAGQCFNMPKGRFFVKGKIEELPNPLDYEAFLYPFERSDRRYESYNTVFTKNPNKASIDFDTTPNHATIYLDHSIEKMPLVVRCYACSHELAHAHYKGENPDDLEKKCDSYAEYEMIAQGFNPSQLLAANEMLLKTGWRKQACSDRLHAHFAKTK